MQVSDICRAAFNTETTLAARREAEAHRQHFMRAMKESADRIGALRGTINAGEAEIKKALELTNLLRSIK